MIPGQLDYICVQDYGEDGIILRKIRVCTEGGGGAIGNKPSPSPLPIISSGKGKRSDKEKGKGPIKRRERVG